MATIHITTKGMIEGIGRLEYIHREIPKALRQDTERIANITAEEIRMSKQQTGIIDFRGILESRIVPKQLKNLEYTIKMPRYAGYLEAMKEHTVWGYKHPIIRQWMKQRYGIENYTGPITVGGTVRKHPYRFIQIAVMRTAQRLRDEVRNGQTLKVLRRKSK